MAKLTKKYFEFSNHTNSFMFWVEVHVDTSGMFHADVPEDMQTIAREKINGRPFTLPSGRLVSSRVNRKQEIDLQSESLEGLCEAIEFFGQEIVSETVISEYVIIYRTNLDVSFYLMTDGEIRQNGEGDTERKGQWIGELNGSHYKGHYSVGIGAKIAEKRRHISKSGMESVTYHHPEKTSLGLAGRRLNSYIGLNTFNQFQRDLYDEQKEIPYTEESAQFFCNALDSMCRLANLIRTTLEDPLALEEKIKDGTMLSLESRSGFLLPDNSN